MIKIILINVNQENGLFDEGFVCNGTNGICLDNLNHIYVQKYVKEFDGYDVTATTNLDSFVDENCKFSNFLADLIVKLLSIEQISHQKMEAKRKWQIFQALTEKNHQLIVIYLQKICFRNERKIKVFSDEVKVREFVTSRCTLN